MLEPSNRLASFLLEVQAGVLPWGTGSRLQSYTSIEELLQLMRRQKEQSADETARLEIVRVAEKSIGHQQLVDYVNAAMERGR